MKSHRILLLYFNVYSLTMTH